MSATSVPLPTETEREQPPGRPKKRPAPRGLSQPPSRLDITKGGAVAGIIGGAIIAVIMLARNAASGQDVWAGMKGAGWPFLGEAAMRPGFELWPVLLGILCHFAVSMAWGIPFGWLAFGRSQAATLVVGALWGLAIWLGMFYVVLPLVGAEAVVRMTPVATAVFEHVLFGLAVAAGFLPFQPTEEESPWS